MQFTNTEDQTMLADSLRGLLTREAAAGSEVKTVWGRLAELGALGASLPEEIGGFGGNGRELCVISAELGRARVAVPYAASVAIFATLIAKGAADGIKKETLEALIAGDLVGTLAWQERYSRYSMTDIETTATQDGEGWVLSGTKSQVMYGDQADRILVTAKSGSDVAIFLINGDAEGVTRTPLTLVDGQPAADITLNNVRVGKAGRLIGGADLLALGLDWGAVALAADSVACMDVLLEKTVEYIKMRVQFGKPIGKNQALQHRATEMLHHIEKCRGLLVMAAESLTSGTEQDRRRAVAQCCYITHKAARFVGEQSVQLHGGMGMTDELDISHYYKRVYLNEKILGDADHQLDVLHGLELSSNEVPA
jgi:alkylation response protein AidB-like acyl-CoA dehydrogenase